MGGMLDMVDQKMQKEEQQEQAKAQQKQTVLSPMLLRPSISEVRSYLLRMKLGSVLTDVHADGPCTARQQPRAISQLTASSRLRETGSRPRLSLSH